MPQVFLAKYFLLALIVFGVNVVPAFMPATWSLLAFFYLRYHLLFAPTIIIGAACATLGRIVLYALSKDFLQPHIPKKSRENLLVLGNYLNKNQKLAVSFVLGYAFLPIPSNQVFIAAGLADVNITLIAFSFFIGRLISYSFWVSLSNRVAKNLETVIIRHYTKIGTPIAELISILLIILVILTPWKKILVWFQKRGWIKSLTDKS
jgi:membrane protein YqaA with SNARE-associated domain